MLNILAILRASNQQCGYMPAQEGRESIMTTNYLKCEKQTVQFISNNKEVIVLFMDGGEVVQAKKVPIPIGRSIYRKLLDKGFMTVKPSYRKVKAA